MQWDDLRFFIAVARQRKLKAAADALNVDATTVGRRLERLAQSLNATLLEPGPNGYVLTPSGEILLRHAEEVERSVLGAAGALTGERSQLAGTVRISMSEGFAGWVVAPRLPEFRERHPHIALDIVTTNGFLNPSKREADLAVMLARPNKGPLLSQKLADYSLGLYASRDYVARHGMLPDAAAIRDHTLIGYIPDFIYADELRYLEEIDSDLTAAFASSSIHIQHVMVRAGLGVGVLPDFIGMHDESLIPQLRDAIAIRRNFWIVVHRDLRRLARVDAVISWLKELCADAHSSLNAPDAPRARASQSATA